MLPLHMIIMMKFIGHTMAVPGMDIAEAIQLFAALGADGIEIVAQEGTPFCIDAPEEEIEKIISASKEYDLPVVTLTPYFWAINSEDDAERRANIEGLKKAIRLAKKMGAKFVRSYGGINTAGGTEEEKTARTVEALKEAGLTAQENGITIIVENHPGTMTRTGTATAEVVKAVNMESVKALYDPCNVLNDTDEDWLTTLEVQRDLIGYIHCKDYRITDGKRTACVVGEGVVPWLEIMRRLPEQDWTISFEYEKRWYPDQIEDAVTGLPRCMKYIKEAMK